MQKAKYLDPEILGTVGSLDVVTRRVVEGIRIGMHRSPLRGISTDFSAYRPYVPGDATRTIDWKVYSRTNRYYVKQYEAETNFVANLLIDASESMTYASGKITKLEYAKYMAASLAYLIVDQRDSCGVAVFDGELQEYIPPKSSLSVLATISTMLERATPRPKTNVAAVLNEFANRMSRRGVVMLFSDLFDNTEAFIKGINHLAFRGHNVVVFHILDPYELTFPLNGMWKFLGLENDGEVITQPARVRAGYLEQLKLFITEIKSACARNHVDYVLTNTATPIEQVVAGYLLQAEAEAKQR